jgi:hypothetical protein
VKQHAQVQTEITVTDQLPPAGQGRSVADDLEPVVVGNVGVAVVVVTLGVRRAGGRHHVQAEGAFLLLVLRVVAHADAAHALSLLAPGTQLMQNAFFIIKYCCML